jgi:ABC-2 type transport system ATP-binding protein
MAAVIELQDMTVRYGSFTALDNVSLQIEAGTIGLLGPNGAGKSTLMRTLLGYNRPTHGAVRMFDLEMPRHALEVRQYLGYMPEREVVSPKVSAVSFITYCGELFGMTRIDALERTHEVLNYVGLGEARYRKMQTYSTGMLQRVKLAQALVHDPRLLLLDEPTNGLDPDGRLEMLELIREIVRKRGVTVVISSHLLPDVQHVCERIIMVHKGQVVRDGSLDDLTTARERRYTVSVRENMEAFAGALQAASIQIKNQQNGRWQVTLPDEKGPGEIFAIALSCGTQLRHFEPARHTLAEVFMEAVEG